jgi:hypothetical protein
MANAIDEKLLKPKAPERQRDWKLWQKKSFNIHRGLIEFAAKRGRTLEDTARLVREGVRAEFRPGWFRGFGFGAIIHFEELPRDFTEICHYVDTRNKRHGVWQWVIACLDEDKVAVAVHTWLHGYLRPVYDSVLQQLAASGYECSASDSEVDALIATLARIAKVGRIIRRAGGLLG